MNPLNEKNHIRQLKKGSIASYEWLYRRYNRKLYGFVYNVSKGDVYLCEEIVQDVFVKIWEKKESLDEDKSFSPFLCTIAKNMLLNLYQRRMLEYLYQEYIESVPVYELAQPDDELDVCFLKNHINNLIRQLPPAREKIFKMSRIDNLSNQEISEKLNISKNAVELQVSRALAFLRKQLSENYQDLIFILLFFAHLFNN